jgi:hypothetical protein
MVGYRPAGGGTEATLGTIACPESCGIGRAGIDGIWAFGGVGQLVRLPQLCVGGRLAGVVTREARSLEL